MRVVIGYLLEHRGLMIGLFLSVLLIEIAVGITIGLRMSDDDRPPTVEERQSRLARCIDHYTEECGLIGPPGPDGRPGR